jgi:hypothetical protein
MVRSSVQLRGKPRLGGRFNSCNEDSGELLGSNPTLRHLRKNVCYYYITERKIMFTTNTIVRARAVAAICAIVVVGA